MLSYLHAFHAGNFADVQKHTALVLALRMMQAKRAAIACFDTHAGSARYNLEDERARKTAEADKGIQAVWQQRARLDSDDWIGLLQPLSKDEVNNRLSGYPGSPALIRHYLREQDRLFAWELHPTEGRSLADWAASDPRIKAMQGDGLAGLIRTLPPSQPRLLALIDPSYEVKTDYEEVARTLVNAWKACRHGVFMIWYPLLPGAPHTKLHQMVRDSPLRKVYCHEIHRQQLPERGMTGSGLMVVNPPWGFDQRLNQMMNDVAGTDALGISVFDQWLIPE